MALAVRAITAAGAQAVAGPATEIDTGSCTLDESSVVSMAGMVVMTGVGSMRDVVDMAGTAVTAGAEGMAHAVGSAGNADAGDPGGMSLVVGTAGMTDS